MTEITPVLGVDPAEFRKAVGVIARTLGDRELIDQAVLMSTEELLITLKSRLSAKTGEHKHCDHKHHCRHMKLDNISSLLEGIEDVLVLQALLDLRADPDKRLSVWKGSQTANDIIRNKINVLLAAGVADAKEQVTLTESEKTPSTAQNTKPEQEVIKVDPNKVLIIEDKDTHNQMRIYVDVKESKTHD